MDPAPAVLCTSTSYLNVGAYPETGCVARRTWYANSPAGMACVSNTVPDVGSFSLMLPAVVPSDVCTRTAACSLGLLYTPVIVHKAVYAALDVDSGGVEKYLDGCAT